MSVLPFLAEDAPEDGQGNVAVAAEREMDGEGQDDVVETVTEDLARLGGKDRIEEDATVGNPFAAFVAQGVVDDEGDEPERDEFGDEQRAEENADIIPVPLSGREE